MNCGEIAVVSESVESSSLARMGVGRFVSRCENRSLSLDERIGQSMFQM